MGCHRKRELFKMFLVYSVPWGQLDLSLSEPLAWLLSGVCFCTCKREKQGHLLQQSLDRYPIHSVTLPFPGAAPPL